MNHVDPAQRQTANIFRSFVTHRTQEEVEPEEEEEIIKHTEEEQSRRSRAGGAASPVSEHHGLLQTLGAGLVEPLLTPEALQHLQVPPADRQVHGEVISEVTVSHSVQGSDWSVLLSGASAVTVTLLLIGPVLGVPVQRVQVVQEHLLHG